MWAKFGALGQQLMINAISHPTLKNVFTNGLSIDENDNIHNIIALIL